ncbi:MAG: hypothetical protein ABFS32_09430 [Bacteroidota bacterium]
MARAELNDELKSLMLLKAIIFHYHGLDEDEEKILNNSAFELNARKELQWAINFIAKDYVTAFERAKVYMHDAVKPIAKNKRLHFINLTWKANAEKGYVTEMEASAMLKIAKDWEVDQELIGLVNHS